MNDDIHWGKRLALISVLVISTIMMFISGIASAAFVLSGSYIKSDELVKESVLDYFLHQDLSMTFDYLSWEYSTQEDFENYVEDTYFDSNVIVRLKEGDKLIYGFNADENDYLTKGSYRYVYETHDGKALEMNLINPLYQTDKFQMLNNLTGQALKYKFWVYPVLIVSIIGFVFSIAIMRKNKKKKETSRLDFIPLDVLLLSLFLVFLMFDGFYQDEVLMVLYLFASLVLVLGILRRRFDNKTLISNNVTVMVLSAINALIKRALENLRLLNKILIVFAVLALLQTILIFMFEYSVGAILIAAYIMDGIMFFLVLKHFVDLETVERGSFEIASGNLDFKFKEDSFIGFLDPISRNLNQVSNATKYAVEREMASERMKTELITNVSHDIKTPITSIINYVDLLQETNDPEKIQEYTEVLVRQSGRLKSLVEDLLEASKLSTGNVELKKEMLDINMLMDQAIGEVSDKFDEKGLQIILNREEGPLMISADGNQLSRLFDNLLYNTYQYSLENTRVYIDIKKDSKIKISMKNISQDALHIDAKTLVERFTRADSSRNTEGSGLGLNIAKSIVELHNGSFNLEIDGDLFKVLIEL